MWVPLGIQDRTLSLIETWMTIVPVFYCLNARWHDYTQSNISAAHQYRFLTCAGERMWKVSIGDETRLRESGKP